MFTSTKSSFQNVIKLKGNEVLIKKFYLPLRKGRFLNLLKNN